MENHVYNGILSTINKKKSSNLWKHLASVWYGISLNMDIELIFYILNLKMENQNSY